MKRHLAISTSLFLVVVALAGCGKSAKPASPLGMSAGGNNGATASDVAEVKQVIASNPAYVNEGEYTTGTEASMTLGAGGMSIMRPIRWWRTIDSTERVVDIEYGDLDSLGHPRAAVATVHKHFTGTLNILAGDTASTDTARRVVHKPLDDDWTRKLAFHRFRIDSTGKGRWHLVGTSGVTVTSRLATTQILSIRIQAGAKDTLITDPLQLHRLRRILWIPDDTPVTVTVRTGRPDDIVVLYHRLERRPFKSNGDNTCTAIFMDPDFPGLRHFGVNAFSRGTLWDDIAPYDSEAWVVPFAVRDRDCDVDRD